MSHIGEAQTILNPQCHFCQKESIGMINKALYQRYSSSQNLYYSTEINELIGEELTKAAVIFLEWQVLDDEDEFLKREYKISQYKGKSKSLGDYYQYHKQLPRFFGLPIETAMKRYHQKIRDHEYKVVKRMMNETQQSLLDPSMVPSHNSSAKSSMSNLLAGLNLQQMKMQESAAFLNVVQQLKQLTKNQSNNFDLRGDLFTNTNVRNFELYLQKIAKRKRKAQISIVSIDKKPSLFKKDNLDEPFQKNIKKQQQDLVMKNFATQSYKFKGKLSQRVDTLLNGLQKTKPMLRNLIPEFIPRLNKLQKQRSIQRIYGSDRYNSLHNRQSTKFMTLASDRPTYEKQKFRIHEVSNRKDNRQLTHIKTIDYRSSNRSLDKKAFKVQLKIQDNMHPIDTTRRKEMSTSKSILKKKSESVPNIKSVRSVKQFNERKKLNPIKVYKKIKGII